jgi:uncharacterized membrane protein YphA (DoxX/SURF4 family)
MPAKTKPPKHLVVVRVFSGGPLLAFGLMHLSGAAPMRPLLEAAGMPAPGLGAVVAPIAQIIAGLMILAGLWTRLGAVIAIGAMLGAVYTHIQIPSDGWPVSSGGPQEPPLMYLALAIIALCGYLLWKGAGAWSVDQRKAA